MVNDGQKGPVTGGREGFEDGWTVWKLIAWWSNSTPKTGQSAGDQIQVNWVWLVTKDTAHEQLSQYWSF